MEFVATNVLGKWHDLGIPERKRLTSIRMDVECSGPSESWLTLDICELNRVFLSAFNISFGLIGRGTIEFQLPNLIAEQLCIRVDPNTIVRGVQFELERFMPKYVSAYRPQSWGDNPPVGPVFSESMESRLDRLAINSAKYTVREESEESKRYGAFLAEKRAKEESIRKLAEFMGVTKAALSPLNIPNIPPAPRLSDENMAAMQAMVEEANQSMDVVMSKKRAGIVSVPIKPEPAVGRKIILFEGD